MAGHRGAATLHGSTVLAEAGVTSEDGDQRHISIS